VGKQSPVVAIALLMGGRPRNHIRARNYFLSFTNVLKIHAVSVSDFPFDYFLVVAQVSN